MTLAELVNPTERQREFWAAVKNHDYVLFGGAAGGGKSYILRWTLVGLLLKWAGGGRRGVRVGLFCEDYPALRDRHLARIRYEFPDWLGTYRDTTHEFELSPSYGSGVISFRNLDDPSKYLSSEFAAIAIDELTRNDQATFDFLRMRLRWPGIEDVKFLAATNPGGPGHGWVKQLWIDRQFPPELASIKRKFAFIQARAEDNPHLPPSYVDGLRTLPEHMRRAYCDGDWDIFAGQVFSEWRRDVHVVEPFDIPRAWTRFRSMDWGFAKPYAIYWYAVDYDGMVYVCRELYGIRGDMPDVGTEQDPTEVAQAVKRLEDGEDIAYGVADPACWQEDGRIKWANGARTVIDAFANEGVYWTKANNARINGKMEVHMRLRGHGKDRPGIRIFSTCQHLIRTLPVLQYSKTHVEDVDTDMEDHAYDSLRYGLMSRPWKPEKAKEPPPDDYGRRRQRQSTTAWSA